MPSSLFTIARIYLNTEFRKRQQTLNLSSKLAKISQSTKRFRSSFHSSLFTSPDIHWDPELDPTKKKTKNNRKETMATSKQSNLSKNNTAEQVYEYLLVLDFEATCDQGNVPEPQVRIKEWGFKLQYKICA